MEGKKTALVVGLVSISQLIIGILILGGVDSMFKSCSEHPEPLVYDPLVTTKDTADAYETSLEPAVAALQNPDTLQRIPEIAALKLRDLKCTTDNSSYICYGSGEFRFVFSKAEGSVPKNFVLDRRDGTYKVIALYNLSSEFSRHFSFFTSPTVLEISYTGFMLKVRMIDFTKTDLGEQDSRLAKSFGRYNVRSQIAGMANCGSPTVTYSVKGQEQDVVKALQDQFGLMQLSRDGSIYTHNYYTRDTDDESGQTSASDLLYASQPICITYRPAEHIVELVY